MERRTHANQDSSLFRKIINILFIVAIFFGLGYWCGKQKYTYRTVIDFLSSKKEKVKEIKKPELEEDTTGKFTFHKSLKDDKEMLLPPQKLKVEKREEDKPVLKPFTLQLASFKKESLAKNYVKELNTIGLHPYIKMFDLKKQGVWYRIFFGEFESKKAAVEYAEQNLKPLNIYFLATGK